MASEAPAPAVEPPAPAVEAAAAAVADVSLGEQSATAVVGVTPHPYSIHDRVPVKSVLSAGLALEGQTVTAGGWVQTGRYGDKNWLAFIELNDGSTPTSLQLVVRQALAEGQGATEGRGLAALVPKSTCLLVRGVVQASKGRGQVIELDVTEIIFVGPCDPSTYPVAKTKLTMEFLRSVIHLRTRTNTIATVRHCPALPGTARHGERPAWGWRKRVNFVARAGRKRLRPRGTDGERRRYPRIRPTWHLFSTYLCA